MCWRTGTRVAGRCQHGGDGVAVEPARAHLALERSRRGLRREGRTVRPGSILF